MKKVTSYDVASKAGVSRATVSLVLNGSTAVSISPETRSRVLEVAKELNYQPNRAGRMLVRGRTETLGIVVTDPVLLAVDGFIALLLQAVIAKSREDGYRVMIDYIGNDGQKTYRDLINEGAVDGLLVISPRVGDADLLAVVESGFPVVLIGSINHPGEVSSMIQTENAFAEIVDHLTGLGHERIAYVSFGPAGIAAADQRIEYYRTALSTKGLEYDPALVVHAAYSARSGKIATSRLLQESDLAPTAIIAGNDTIAIGVLSAVAETGLGVPEDISVVGFDDLPISTCLLPPLTTVHHDIVQRARSAVETLILRVRGQPTATRQLELPTSLIIRESTGPVRESAYQRAEQDQLSRKR
ncbi:MULTISPECIES: LacI family DNA-binding transcriptional regulator [Mesorhizobium]|uniref:LacI family transcriptional regulator n=1 Tax=Mesorhizobium denitrificans TaxID=2294114 RepID=A0A371XCP5_9HYPH|nr:MULTISPECIES: LacI family DNA-binding transcriptional regulator [Mesorhizobium]RFC67007.1 LacI family transcriptional regulator [Mesorhizobium denitrificans]